MGYTDLKEQLGTFAARFPCWMALDGAPCCYAHFQIGLATMTFEGLRSSRLPEPASTPRDPYTWNHRIDAALGLANGKG